MRWTLSFYYDFGPGFTNSSLMSAGAWDALRLEAGAQEFALPTERDKWLEYCRCQHEAFTSAAQIQKLAAQRGCSTIFSVGVGRACLEYHLKARFPELTLISTEFSERVVEALQLVFIECDDIKSFDMTAQPWPDLGPHALHLLHRVDTGLSDSEWRRAFGNMARANVNHVLVSATGFLTAKTLAAQILSRSMSRLRRRRLTFSGYIRTKAMFQTLWRPHYEVDQEHVIGNLTGFLLRRV